MQRIAGFITVFFFFSISVFSQHANLSGTLTAEKEKIPVYNSVIALITPVDSILCKFTRSDKNGNFNFKNVKPGSYILMTTHYQYADYLDPIIVKENENKLGIIALKSKIELLREVVIKTGSIRIKGDTTSYRASDFAVSENANVEELLKKLPGIQVDKSGNIKAMGETVKKVLVDGEEFFGDDPGMAVKNLRADAVKEVQVFDKKSEQAEFTGIDDGNTQKTINLKLKEDKKKGYFGKIDGANEPFTDADSRYNTNLMFSSFKGKRKLSAFLLNGNTGQDGLGWEDSDRFGSREDDFSMNMDDDGNVQYQWSENNDGEPYVDTRNGFIKNTNGGIQYTNKWNEKHKLNASPKFNKQNYTNNMSRISQTQVGESQLNVNEATVTNVDRSNFKFRATYDVKLDSLNSLKISANTNFYDIESDEFTNGTTTDKEGILKNKQQRAISANIDKSALSTSILFKHKFAKPRRTFTINGSWMRLNTSLNNFLKSTNESFIDGVFATKNDVDQNKFGDRSNQNLSTSISYSEPLSKKYSLQVAYQINFDKGRNDFFTYDFSLSTGEYDQLVASLSNEFEQTIITHRPNLKLSYNSKKVNYSVGSGFGFTSFDFLDKTMDQEYQRRFTNFFPSASFSYKFKNNGNFRINYNGLTIQPTLDQLQPLRNNQDFFNQIVGNPDLKQSFRNEINLNLNSYSIVTETYFYQGISFNTTANAIIYSNIIDPETAKTISKPINSDGNYSGNIYVGYGTKFKKYEVDFSLSPFLGFNKSALNINNQMGSAQNLNTGFWFSIGKTKQKKYNISLRNNFSYNRNSTTQNSQINSFNTNTLNLDVGVYIKEKWKITSEYNLFTRQKTAEFQDNLSNQLWNARLQRTFKNDEFTAYLLVNDILNQNIGIDRSNVGNTISQVQNDRLKRYAMIGFTWNFKNKGE